MAKRIVNYAAILGYVLLVLMFAGFWIYTHTGNAARASELPCPAGSYSIGIDENGQHICKQEPTGCPYGDSIPMDMCDKFVPVNEHKDQGDLPDPDRPYYDAEGNKFDASGNLIEAAPQPATIGCGK